MPKTTEDNAIVRLLTPASVKKTGKPEVFHVEKNGQVYAFKWGNEYRISHHCDPDNKVGSLEAKSGYPLIRDEFYQQHKDKFKIINEE